jgi:hypothetical protein
MEFFKFISFIKSIHYRNNSSFHANMITCITLSKRSRASILYASDIIKINWIVCLNTLLDHSVLTDRYLNFSKTLDKPEYCFKIKVDKAFKKNIIPT